MGVSCGTVLTLGALGCFLAALYARESSALFLVCGWGLFWCAWLMP